MPWGLNGYGFDPYIAATPGNAVLALARFWADNVTGTLAAEERFAEHSIRVRYEDLVTDPEGTAHGNLRVPRGRACSRDRCQVPVEGNGSGTARGITRSGTLRGSRPTRSAGAGRSQPP